MKTITQAEWDQYPSDYKGVWSTERTDWPTWEQDREKYMGKRTMMTNHKGGTRLEIEGLHFEIKE